MGRPDAWRERVHRIPIDGTIAIEGNLNIPQRPRGVIVFAHGSGGSRHSPRGQYVARMLHEIGFATLLINLLASQEESADRTSGYRHFSVAWLSGRVLAATAWLREYPETNGLAVGYFGGSLGGSVVLMAAATCPDTISAVVVRGGDPGLARSVLAEVRSPTLLLVGSRDTELLAANQAALPLLTCTKRLEVIEGATHLFEEPGALARVARCACQWFVSSFSEGAE